MPETGVVVVGAGHAGIEAALACARMGVPTTCVTLRLDRIGHLPCNCSIGGPAKGHIAREVDALGGEMGVATDAAMTHLRRVGTGSGPAVQTLRAHVCKDLYPRTMRRTLEAEPNLTVIEGKVVSLAFRGGRVGSCQVEVGDASVRLQAKAIVLTTGTFLNGLCHEGHKQTRAARHGDQASTDISQILIDLGIRLRRFKTGTTPRISKGSIDFSRVTVLPSEPEAGPFSFASTDAKILVGLLPCWGTRTTEATHELVRENLRESAMYGGRIEGTGPRYCPSIEDKIVRFAEKSSHPIWLEQETWTGDEIYVQGMSTSLPAEIQNRMLRSVPGLEGAFMIRPGYAVEYDMADPLQLTPHLMSKLAEGLFLAGQLNGTSGYEEAAGQGIVSGINAARFALGEEPIEFPRANSFIGVMVDDLVTKGVDDPYRMLTARAEHRLLLRHDNADARLTPLSREVGLCSEARWRTFSEKQEEIAKGHDALCRTCLSSVDNPVIVREGEAPLVDRVSLLDLMRRPEINLDRALDLAGKCGKPTSVSRNRQVREQLQLKAAFAGYIDRQERSAERTLKLENLRIPDEMSFELPGVSFESREKLARVRPRTIGQAARIPGVRPSDVALLVGHIRKSSHR